MARSRGFTLIEMLVVLALLGLAAAVVAPSLRRADDGPADALGELLPHVRAVAASRGETMYLRIAESGDWRIEGAASADEPAVETGRVDRFEGLPLVLVVAPTGTCGLDAWSAASATAVAARLDPLACELRPS